MSIVSRRYTLHGRDIVKAGADCSRCNRSADYDMPSREYVCPGCGDRARCCLDSGGKTCVLVKGHQDRHESASGSTWH